MKKPMVMQAESLTLNVGFGTTQITFQLQGLMTSGYKASEKNPGSNPSSLSYEFHHLQQVLYFSDPFPSSENVWYHAKYTCAC